MLEKVLWTALDKLGVLRDGTTFENCRITGKLSLPLSRSPCRRRQSLVMRLQQFASIKLAGRPGHLGLFR